MDIASNSAGPSRGGHANLGGMDIVEEMYLTEREVPTIIVTGFDYFVSSAPAERSPDAHSFDDIEGLARKWLGWKLLGCVKYGRDGWEADFRRFLGEVRR